MCPVNPLVAENVAPVVETDDTSKVTEVELSLITQTGTELSVVDQLIVTLVASAPVVISKTRSLPETEEQPVPHFGLAVPPKRISPLKRACAPPVSRRK